MSPLFWSGVTADRVPPRIRSPGPKPLADSVPLETDTLLKYHSRRVRVVNLLTSVLDAQREGLQSIDLGNFYAPKLN